MTSSADPATHREVSALHRHFAFAGLLHCFHGRCALRKVKEAVVAKLVGVIRRVQNRNFGQLLDRIMADFHCHAERQMDDHAPERIRLLLCHFLV